MGYVNHGSRSELEFLELKNLPDKRLKNKTADVFKTSAVNIFSINSLNSGSDNYTSINFGSALRLVWVLWASLWFCVIDRLPS
jgi:hypothetical protein